MDFTTLFFFANILFCAAYVVRDILWLRVLTIVACLSTFPYFYFQPEPLYSAMFWQSAFILINVFNLTNLLLERRPVELPDDISRLHTLVFRSLTPREVLKLFSIAEWDIAKPGEFIVRKDQIANHLLLIYSGKASVESDGEQFAVTGDGQFIAEMSYMTGMRTSADVVASSEVRYVRWTRKKLDAFFEKESGIKNVLQVVLSHDLIGKLKQD
ncbi:MAG: cyclic nucleotide-binding domain-containing protein [Sulfuriflexus sp.]|nr:cyclic nucleotide-binding domain-containing protein [Sulfuriflexus sp.]